MIVDALLGTGLSSKVKGIYAEAIALINNSGKPVIAVDIPSGIDAATGRVLGCAVKADFTVTFALAKCGHLLYPGAEYTGRLRIVDIGIPAEITAAAEGYEFLDAEAVRPLLKRRSPGAHKGDSGHCLIVAGSTGKTGAAAMAANSAVRAGAGLVTLAVPASLNAILEMKTTEAMTIPIPDNDSGLFGDEAFIAILSAIMGKDAVALGPGISLNPGIAMLVRDLVANVSQPLVIDADGLNALSEDPDILLRKKSATVILTPHPGEMGRLAALSTAEVESDRIGVARAFAVKYRIYLILKGARTIIAAPDGAVAINGSGNPGMASGGMGDVLTGVLAALLAQGYEPFHGVQTGGIHPWLCRRPGGCRQGGDRDLRVDVQERLPYAIKDG